MRAPIQFIVQVAKWDIYHSCRITRTSDGETLSCPFQYGYGDDYRQTALFAMGERGWLGDKYRDDRNAAYFNYERENGYPIEWVVHEGLKRDCVALGK